MTPDELPPRTTKVHATIASKPDVRVAIALLTKLYVDGPYFPDFLTPASGTFTLDEGIETVLSTPRRQLAAQLARLGRSRHLPRWVEPLSNGEPAMMWRLGAALRVYHDDVLGQFMVRMRAALDAHRAVQTRRLLHGGLGDMLSHLGPTMRWRAPFLEVDYPEHRDLLLDGRGLLLVPSFFCYQRPVSLADPELSPVLVYPIEHKPDWLRPGPTPERSPQARLAALLGSTRAAILETTTQGCTTTELAQRAGVSLATASHHASTLREAALITSTRQGNEMIHIITPLGAELCG